LTKAPWEILSRRGSQVRILPVAPSRLAFVLSPTFWHPQRKALKEDETIKHGKLGNLFGLYQFGIQPDLTVATIETQGWFGV
jgi:hypothetical protein